MKVLGIVLIIISIALFITVAIYWHKINKE